MAEVAQSFGEYIYTYIIFIDVYIYNMGGEGWRGRRRAQLYGKFSFGI